MEKEKENTVVSMEENKMTSFFCCLNENKTEIISKLLSGLINLLIKTFVTIKYTRKWGMIN